MKARTSLIHVLPLACLLGGCAAAGTHYYTLVGPATQAGTGDRTAPFSFSLTPIDVPAQVDRQSIVLRDGAGSLQVQEQHRWGAALPAELRQALANDLGRRLHAIDVSGLPQRTSAPDYRIQVQVTRFDSTYGRSVDLGANWAVVGRGSAGTLECRSRLSAKVGAGYAALALGHQQLLSRLAGQIAGVVQTMAREGKASCP
jgi:Uncharacterized protein conserved in bacteria